MPEELKKKKKSSANRLYGSVFQGERGEKHNISGLKKENLVVIFVDL